MAVMTKSHKAGSFEQQTPQIKVLQGVAPSCLAGPSPGMPAGLHLAVCRQAKGLLLVSVSSQLLGAPIIRPSVPSVPREPGPERSGTERGGGVAGAPLSRVQPDSPPRWRQEVHPGRGGVLHSQQVRRPQRGEEQDAGQWPEDTGPGQGAPGFCPRKHRPLHPELSWGEACRMGVLWW